MRRVSQSRPSKLSWPPSSTSLRPSIFPELTLVDPNSHSHHSHMSPLLISPFQPYSYSSLASPHPKTPAMICPICQPLLNLDTLLTHASHPFSRPYHTSFAALQTSATAGCELCTLFSAVPRGSYLARLHTLVGKDAQLAVDLAPHDILHIETKADWRLEPTERWRGLALSPVEGMSACLDVSRYTD